MAFTNFCCRSGGSNLNAGTRTGSTTEPGTSADFTYASGNWVQSTRVFTVASGNPSTDGVAVGDFVSVYADGSTVTGYVARVTAVSSTTITTSSAALAGTAPTDGTGARTLKVGGAWLGPNAASGFPFTILSQSLVNTSSNPVRLNLKNDATYSVTAAVPTDASIGRFAVQGYTSAYGDLGRFTIDGGTSGASFALVTTANNSSGAVAWYDGIFSNNGATGSADLVTGTSRSAFHRCVFAHSRGNGLNTAGYAEECEAYDCNQSNTASKAGITGVTEIKRCTLHDNTGSNTSGAIIPASGIADKCIFDTNGGAGATCSGDTWFVINSCDFYGNGGSGLALTASSSAQCKATIDNCNFVKNGAYGISITGSNNLYASVRNCGYGSGTQVNTSGAKNVPATSNLDESGAVTYASNVTPWVDPANGDFRINLAAAKGAGRGAFTQTAASYAGTVGYPDIGSAQHQDSGSGGAFPVIGLSSPFIRGKA